MNAKLPIWDAEKYHDLFETSEVGFCIVSATGAILNHNPSFERILGYSGDAVDRLQFSQIQPDDEASGCLFAQLDPEGWIPEHNARLRKRDGGLLQVRLSGRRICYADKTAYLVSVADRRREAHLKQVLAGSMSLWEATFNALSEWVAIIDENHRILMTNQQVRTLFMVPREDAVGSLCHRIIHRTDCPIGMCPLKRSMESGRREEMDLRTDGGRWLQVSVDPIKSDYTPRLFVHIVRDLTPFKQREGELIAARKVKAFRILAGGIAHDYNNLLAIIWGNVSLMKDDITDPLVQDMFADMEAACEQARSLTHQFITLSDSFSLKIGPHAVDDILKESIEPHADLENLDITIKVDIEKTYLEVDKKYLKTAFQHIIQNAVEAMPGGGELEIRVELTPPSPGAASRFVRVAITDSGAGIPESDIGSIFDPYFSSKSKGIHKGMGLGLAVAQSIIAKHGGHIEVDSTPGQGTCVLVSLPSTAHFDISMPELTSPTSLPKGNVLLMDDEAAIRKVCVRMLNQLNYGVLAASNGQEAIAAYVAATKKGIDIDLLLFDQNIIGGIGGVETLRRLHHLGFEGKAVIVTGSPGSPVIADYERYGFDARLLKPFTKTDMKAVVDGQFAQAGC